MFGRTDPAQLRDTLYWLAILLVSLALVALYIGIRLCGFLVRRQPYTFVRVASAFGVMVAAAFLLLLAQSGLTETWLNWASTGCLDENGIQLCGATPSFPDSYRLFLVAQYTGLLGNIRFWGAVSALLIMAFSLALLWLPTTPARAVALDLARISPGTAPSCQWCGVRGEYREGSTSEPAICILCQPETFSNDGPAPPARPRRWPWQRGAAILLLVLLSARMAAAQSDEPATWLSPDIFCAEPGVACLELFPDGGTTDGISDLRINSLSDTSAQPVLEISLNIDEGLFTDEVDKVRLRLPSFRTRIPTLTVPGSCELVIAALASTPAAGTADGMVTAQPYVEFTAEQASRVGSRSLRAFAYCAHINLPGSPNPGFPVSSSTESLFVQADAEHLGRLGEVLTTVRGRLATVFERLQQQMCPNAPNQAPLTFNSLGAQMAVFIAQQIVEGENWQEQVWERYRTLQPFTDNYAGLYCLLDQTPLPPQAALSNFPDTDTDLRSGFLVPLIDASSGDIVRWRLEIKRDGIFVYDDDRLPVDQVFQVDRPGLYTFIFTVSGPPVIYQDGRVVDNSPAVFSRTLNVLAVGGTPEPTPVGPLDQPVFDSQSLDLPMLDEDTLTVNQAIGLTFGSLIVAGVGWGLLLYLPRRLRRLVSFVLTAAVLVAVALWIVSRL